MKKDNDLFNLVVVIALCIAGAFVVKYGWNNIVVTILPVKKINAWQAFGLDSLLSFILPSNYSDIPASERIKHGISKTIAGFLLIWIASVFI